MTKQDILDYVISTPYNTNKNVLEGMLDEYAESDNKQEIELSATENKVYTPDTGKVYKKVTVNVPAPVSDWTTATVTVVVGDGGGLDNNYLTLPVIESNTLKTMAIYNEGTYTIPLYKGTAQGYAYRGVDSVSGDCTVSNDGLIITGDCTITFTP